nr:MAG TPA: hypothetical protein [Caudoviricetes sp.]
MRLIRYNVWGLWHVRNLCKHLYNNFTAEWGGAFGMKYDFRVGDYVEDVTGRVGYIQSICQCEQCKARGFYEPFVLYTDGNGDYITAYEYEKGFPGYKRIGQYTFAQAVQVPQSVQVPKIDKLIYTDETAILWKLNELVDAVNELRMRDAKESKDD